MYIPHRKMFEGITYVGETLDVEGGGEVRNHCREHATINTQHTKLTTIRMVESDQNQGCGKRGHVEVKRIYEPFPLYIYIMFFPSSFRCQNCRD